MADGTSNKIAGNSNSPDTMPHSPTFDRRAALDEMNGRNHSPRPTFDRNSARQEIARGLADTDRKPELRIVPKLHTHSEDRDEQRFSPTNRDDLRRELAHVSARPTNHLNQSPSHEITPSAEISAEPEKKSWWGSAWDSVCSVGSTIVSAGKNLARAGVAVVKSIPKAIAAVPALIEKTGEAIEWMANNPDKVWNGICTAGKMIKDGGVWTLTILKDAAIYTVTHPREALGAALDFGKGLCDSIGITDITNGVCSFGKGLYYTATGDWSKARNCFIDSGRAVKGALVMACEFTGLADTWRCVEALAKGDFASAALYGGLAAANIAGLIYSGGLYNAGRMAATNGIRLLAKEAGEQIAKEAVEKITVQTLKQTGELIAKESLEQVGKLTAKELSESAVKKICNETADKMVTQLLKTHGVEKMVEETVYKVLRNSADASVKELSEKLGQLGIKEGSEKFAAKMLQRALKNGGLDDVLKETIIKEISHELKEELLKKGLRESFNETFERGMKEIAKKHGLSDDIAKKLIAAGKEGFEEGVESAVKRVVREGVEEAFRRFREDENRRRRRHGNGDERKVSTTEGITSHNEPNVAPSVEKRASTPRNKRGGGGKLPTSSAGRINSNTGEREPGAKDDQTVTTEG